MDGYGLSGHSRSIGPLSVTFEEGQDNPMNVAVVGSWLGQATISPGTLNVIFDNTATTGSLALLGTAGVKRNLMVAQGIQAAPAMGDPAFIGQFTQDDFMTAPSENPIAATIQFGPSNGLATTLNYTQPWGVLVHANGAETASSTDSGIDQLAESSSGGYMMYQVMTAAGAGDITATLKLQDSTSTDDGDFGDLLSSGVINCGALGAAVPTSGVVALGVTATVKRYIRWQVVLGTATSVTFTMAFVRG